MIFSIIDKEKAVKKIFAIIFVLWGIAICFSHLEAEENKSLENTALLIIDVQDFYFPGGGYEIVNPEAASGNAAKLLKKFRDEGRLVIHIRHNVKSGGEIHASVRPLKDEMIISKNHANSFKDTELLEFLKINEIEGLVICGMMTHMCVEAATRAACDYGFDCIVVHDACATRALTFNEIETSAEDVHNATLSALSGSYAKIIDTETFLSGY